MIEAAFDWVSDSIEEMDEKFYGVTVGTVINVLDPMMLGRVQVKLPFIDSLDLSPWARVAVPMTGKMYGTYFIPGMDDEVLIAFEHGDVNAPYVIGCLWNAKTPPPLPSPVAQVRMIKTPQGNQIMFTDLPGASTIMIQTPTRQTILMSTAGIQITTDSTVINLSKDGVTITGTNVNIVGTTAVNISAPTVSISSTTATNVTSTGNTTVAGSLVKINS
ncbi:MAG: phage tail protein [Chloroflexi bacterium]|jgi:uncharacterized protein involved in type VI secretion and phage assembly|nr:phage tail protein [Chloroflexota bacterium]